MAATITGADSYITSNVIMADDWSESDAERKQRILNVASRILSTKYADYTIPDNAVYEFCAVLATQYNDTNALFQQGLAGFSITGVGSWTDKQDARKPAEELIPRASIDYINADTANEKLPKLSAGRAIKWTVM